MAKIGIAGRSIGAGEPVFLIAEAGVNHNGDPAMAVRLVDVAAEAGADAVKFQTFEPEYVASAWAPKAQYQLRATDCSESQLSMLRQLKLPREAHIALSERCRLRGVVFLSTPFDAASVDFLASLGVPAFKVGSGDLTNHPLLKQVARTR